MIVCHCHAVNDGTILEAIAEGARDIASIGTSCRAGTGCGGCHQTLARLLDAAVAVEEAFVDETLVDIAPSPPGRTREAARH